MPTLLEVQRAMRASLVAGDDAAAAGMLADGIGGERLGIYRNTYLVAATRALRLNFPAVAKLVGAEFFDGAAGIFATRHPPTAACLDDYGEGFADFLAGFAPAARLVYLRDVARLEWAVGRALHAPDRDALDLARLAALTPDDRVVLVPHPALTLLSAGHPADLIWRATLADDTAALAAIDPGAGPVHLVVRRTAGVEVARLDESAWRFAKALCAGEPVEAALGDMPDARAYALLAEYLAAGWFVDFYTSDRAERRAAP
jgi:hypothetical protein